MNTNPHPGASSRTATRRRPGIVAASAVIAVVVASIALLSCDEAPSESTATPTSNDTSFAAADALSVAGDYFERYNAGDVAGVLALFAPDATFTDRWGEGPNDGYEYTFEFFVMLLEWNVAGETQLIDPVCSESAEPVPPPTRPGSTSAEVRVVCEFGDHQVRTQVAGRVPVSITLTSVISADGIHEWHRVFGRPNFADCCNDFELWVTTFHRDDFAAYEYGEWTSVEEARTSGELTARFAKEWVAFTRRGVTNSSPRVCKATCSATQPDESSGP